jgi:hypothetical protein
MWENVEVMHKCNICMKAFSTKHNLRRHKEEQHFSMVSKYRCPFCTHVGSRANDVLRFHVRREHPDKYDGLRQKDLKRVVHKVDRRKPRTTLVCMNTMPHIPQVEIAPLPPKRKLEPVVKEGHEADVQSQDRAIRVVVPQKTIMSPNTQAPFLSGPLASVSPISRISVSLPPSTLESIPAISLQSNCSQVVPAPATVMFGSQVDREGYHCRDSETQTEEFRDAKAVAATSETNTRSTSDADLVHSHIKKTIRYPDGRVDEEEESKWYLPVPAGTSCNFACCSSKMGSSVDSRVVLKWPRRSMPHHEGAKPS